MFVTGIVPDIVAVLYICVDGSSRNIVSMPACVYGVYYQSPLYLTPRVPLKNKKHDSLNVKCFLY